MTCGSTLIPPHGYMVPQKDGSGEALVMSEDKVNVELLNAAGAEINNAMTNPFFGKL